jgi:RecB family exonuclease
VAELENRFTWSASRRNTFEYCERQYWWSYYGSWGGWNRDAQPEARQAYILKNLYNRWTWAGTVVHEAIEGVLRRLQAAEGQLAFEGAETNVAAEIEAATHRMREQWVESRSGAYRRRPKRSFGLSEHEYDVSVPRAEWQATNQKVRDALKTFLTSELFERIGASDPKTWLPIETLDQFDFEGTGIWAVLDFAWQDPEGHVEIFDWKTGAVKPDANRDQIACYTLYVQSSRGVPPEDVTTHLVYLGRDLQDFDYRMTEDDLQSVREVMRASIATMRERLQDAEKNIAVRDDFPLTEDRSRCQVCAYRRLCGRV